MKYQTSEGGVQFIKVAEGLRLTAYKDKAGVLTIGYGMTANVKEGQVITEAQADSDLRIFLKWQDEFLSRALGDGVNTNQFDAISSLAYNVGMDAIKKSTLVSMLNRKDVIGAANEFLRWNKYKDEATGKIMVCEGLASRRIKERSVFLRPV